MVSLENNRLNSSSNSSGRCGSRTVPACADLRSPKTMEVGVCFPALTAQKQSRCNGNVTKVSTSAEKKHWETVSIVVFQYQKGEVGERKSECSGTRKISPLPQLVPMMWKSSVWRNQTERKITEALVVAAVGVDTGISQQYWLQWSHPIALSLEPGQRNQLIRSPTFVKRVVFNVAPTQPGTYRKI